MIIITTTIIIIIRYKETLKHKLYKGYMYCPEWIYFSVMTAGLYIILRIILLLAKRHSSKISLSSGLVAVSWLLLTTQIDL